MEQTDSALPANTLLFSKKDILVTTLLSLIYLVLCRLIVGYKIDQLFLVAFFNILYYASFATRRLVTGFSIFIAYWIVFDFMKAIPNYNYNIVHIESLYQAEKQLFGIDHAGTVLTPNEYLAIHSRTFLDVLAGLFYLCWVPVPLIFAAFLFYYNRSQFINFALTFFLVNLLGFVVYYIYPAAPPWYVQQHGFNFIKGTPGNTGGLHRFDDYFNLRLFSSLYEISSNVFAAMPSLHSAYPVIVLYYGIKNKVGWWNVPFALIMAGIWFAAVYTSHHYILDVLAGMLCAICGIYIFNQFILPQKHFVAFKNRFLKRMSAGSRMPA